jgi:hypothetical protein
MDASAEAEAKVAASKKEGQNNFPIIFYKAIFLKKCFLNAF